MNQYENLNEFLDDHKKNNNNHLTHQTQLGHVWAINDNVYTELNHLRYTVSL